jgi:NitT/TauT family transport system ATP-binding protein
MMRDVQVTLRLVNRFFPRSDGGELHALGPIDLELKAGEFFSVVGPSGCGKSTLLEIIAGLSPASSGEVLFEGHPIGGDVPEGIGVVFQEDACFPWLSVRDNIAFGLSLIRVDPAETKRRIEKALDLVGLRDFADAYPAQLSGGMRQRVCIARTLVLQPRLILLDEPFGALDQQTRLLMGDEVLRLWRATGATVLLITHSLDEAAMLSDRVAVMSSRPGRFLEIVETGWSKDRDSRLASDAAFGQLTSHLWFLLRGESMKAMRGSQQRAEVG